MKSKMVVAMVMAAALVSAEQMYAAPTAVRTGVRATYAKVKLVRFTLQSTSSEPMKLKIGEKEVTLLPGKSVEVNATDGQQIVTEEATATHKAGTVLAVAGSELQGATVTVQ